MIEQRLGGLPRDDVGAGLCVFVAATRGSRLLGLALLDELPESAALLLPRCRSVHTFGMRFGLDVIFLAPDGSVLRVVEGVGPGRLLGCRRAAAVLEARAGHGRRFAAAGAGRVAVSRHARPCEDARRWPSRNK